MISPISDRRAQALQDYEKVKRGFLRQRRDKNDGVTLYQCEKCKAWFPKHRSTIHHKRGRIGALLNDTRHWALLCIGCHIWVTNNPDEARELGLLCEKGLWNTVDRSPNAP